MPNTISLFSGFNTYDDLLPSDLAKDLYQIITALKSKYDSADDEAPEYIDILKKHIIDYHNPHKLTTIDGIKDSLINTIYSYYKTYYNTDDDDKIYSQSVLHDLTDQDVISLLELLRRIQLNGFRWIDGYSFDNSNGYLLKNYFTNDFDSDVLSSDISPIYHASRYTVGRDFPYLDGLSKYNGESTLVLDKLKSYFLYRQDRSPVDPSYGLSYSIDDCVLLGWDERYVSSNGNWTMIVSPSKDVILIRPSFDNGVYSFIVTLGKVDVDNFNITVDTSTSFKFRSDIPKCALTFGTNNIGYVTCLTDGSLKLNTIEYPYNQLGNYTTGKLYTGSIIDGDILPNSVIDPNINGKPDTSFTPNIVLTAYMTLLDINKATVPNNDSGYIPNSKYLVERFAQP